MSTRMSGARETLWEMVQRYEEGRTGADDIADLLAAEVRFVASDGTVTEGRDRVLDYLRREEAAFPGWEIDVELVGADGDVGALQWSMRARHTQDLTLPSGQVLPASGREVAVDGVSVLRVRDGEIVEFRRFSDRLGLLAQLGLLPT